MSVLEFSGVNKTKFALHKGVDPWIDWGIALFESLFQVLLSFLLGEVTVLDHLHQLLRPEVVKDL